MVYRVYPGTSDFENLSRLRTEEAAEAASAFDFSRVVVNKPWGYEYLWFQNSSVAVWMLHLAEGRATSMHCHARKRTSLIVMEGEVECATFENRYVLQAGQSVVLEPCVFHSSRARSPGGAFVMEVETPPLKGDLLRYRDDFGRAGRGYEAAEEYSTDFAAYDYRPLRRTAHGEMQMKFRAVTLHYCSLRSPADLAAACVSGGVAVPVLGRLVFGRDVIADIGQAMPLSGFALERCPSVFAPVEVLHILPV
jgi:mannose-6-phosphate isomerase-like protein (cupin superfamily)